MNLKKQKNYYCYILKNNLEQYSKRTYNGYTTNLKRRIRQHNGELKGGAKRTSRIGKGYWEFYVIITGFPDKINTLQCEYRILKPTNKKRRPGRYNSQEGRIKGLVEVLKLDKWTNNSTIQNINLNLTIYVNKKFSNLFIDIPSNFKINFVDNVMDIIEHI